MFRFCFFVVLVFSVAGCGHFEGGVLGGADGVVTRSSRLDVLRYVEETGELVLRFDSEAVRLYEGVPSALFSRFVDSGGYYGFYRTQIKDRFPSRMLARSRGASGRVVGRRMSLYGGAERL